MGKQTTQTNEFVLIGISEKISELWQYVSNIGISVNDDVYAKKRIISTNRLSILMFVFVSISISIFSTYYKDSALIFIIASINFVPLITLLLNSFSETNFSRLFMGIMTPVIILFSIVLLKKLSEKTSFQISEYHFYTPRYYLVAMCLLPLFLIDIRERKMYALALAINAVILIMFDFAHEMAGVGHEHFGFQFHNYYQATIMPVVLLFFLYGSIIFYQFESKNYEEKINELLEIEKNRNQQSAEEMQLAKTVIDGLLPKHLPSINNTEVAASLIWSKEVGGDYYTIKKIDSENYLIVIADVAGKGLAASIIVSTIHSCIETQMSVGVFNLKQFVLKLNDVLCKITEGNSFTTCFTALYNETTGELESINAGHPAPFLIKKNDLIELSKGGTILGIFDEGYNIQSEFQKLESKDILVLFTDGLTEASNEKERLYGDDSRMMRCIQNNKQKSSQSIIRVLMEDIKDFSKKETFDDDFTCLVLRRE